MYLFSREKVQFIFFDTRVVHALAKVGYTLMRFQDIFRAVPIAMVLPMLVRDRSILILDPDIAIDLLLFDGTPTMRLRWGKQEWIQISNQQRCT